LRETTIQEIIHDDLDKIVDQFKEVTKDYFESSDIEARRKALRHART
jgi:hypothetical protein